MCWLFLHLKIFNSSIIHIFASLGCWHNLPLQIQISYLSSFQSSVFYHRKYRILILNFTTFHDLHSAWKSIFCLFACIKLVFFSWTIFSSFLCVYASDFYHFSLQERICFCSKTPYPVSYANPPALRCQFVFFRKHIVSFCTSKNGQVLKSNLQNGTAFRPKSQYFFSQLRQDTILIKLAAAAAVNVSGFCAVSH